MTTPTPKQHVIHGLVLNCASAELTFKAVTTEKDLHDAYWKIMGLDGELGETLIQLAMIPEDERKTILGKSHLTREIIWKLYKLRFKELNRNLPYDASTRESNLFSIAARHAWLTEDFRTDKMQSKEKEDVK